MRPQTKIATCCYCGKRTSLQLTARGGHELACGSCGAPLHDMKPVKMQHAPKSKSKHKKHKSDYDSSNYDKPKKRKKSKPLWQKALGEAFDVIEDIFD